MKWAASTTTTAHSTELGADNDDAFAMDEEWDFSVWGDPDPDRCLSYLNMTLQSVIWQLEQDRITETRKGQMSRFIDLLRTYILSQRGATDVATGSATPCPANSAPAPPPGASVSQNALAAMSGTYRRFSNSSS